MAKTKRRVAVPDQVWDEGRLIIRKVADHKYIGIRIPSLTVIHARCSEAVKTAHECYEAAERMKRAGISTHEWGYERPTPAEKRRRRECIELAFHYLTMRI